MTKPTETQATINESETSALEGRFITNSVVGITCDDKTLKCDEDCHNVNCSENTIEYNNSIII